MPEEDTGDPRCCKRDSYLSIQAATDFVAKHFGITMDSAHIACKHRHKNNQCIKHRCPFHSPLTDLCPSINIENNTEIENTK